MHQPWAAEALSLPCFQKKCDARDGKVLFRGPRLKMGVCEGRPQAIEPDHLARADYHGHNVNMAARYCETTAQGGQIVCDAGLARRAAASWRKEIAAEAVRGYEAMSYNHSCYPTAASVRSRLKQQ